MPINFKAKLLAKKAIKVLASLFKVGTRLSWLNLCCHGRNWKRRESVQRL